MPEIFKSEILEKKQITPTVVCIKFSLPKEFDFIPGQYLSISRISDGKKLRTPYSISSFRGKAYGEFCVKIIDVGKTSSHIGNLKPGDLIELFGPLGKFGVKNKNKNLVFISTGTGIAPFLPMISDLLKNKFQHKITLLKGFRDESEILYEEEFSNLRKKHSNFEFFNILSQPKNKNYKFKGHVQDFVKKSTSDFFICGLSEMIESVKKKLTSLGISENEMFYEKYD